MTRNRPLTWVGVAGFDSLWKLACQAVWVSCLGVALPLILGMLAGPLAVTSRAGVAALVR
jgi:hypothetical protein